jgi:hypothetical protein
VVGLKPVEEDFVGILQSAQIDVSLQVVVLSLAGLVRAYYLLLKALDMRRQQPVQAKHAPFVRCERGAFVQPLAVQEIHAARDIWPTLAASIPATWLSLSSVFVAIHKRFCANTDKLTGPGLPDQRSSIAPSRPCLTARAAGGR